MCVCMIICLQSFSQLVGESLLTGTCLPSPADRQQLEHAGHRGALTPHWGRWTDGWMNARMQNGRVGALGSAGEVTVNGGTITVPQWGLPPFFF